ncbi:MAG: DUF2917 domain-containing protein [Proteobacteria bacterium]|nr:DUF2917 domain-containing protein [Pseudomonadota bacterium]
MSAFDQTFAIGPGEPANLGSACGQRLHIQEGTAWITQGDERDIILEAGGNIFLDGPGHALVTALQGRVVFDVEPARATALAA